MSEDCISDSHNSSEIRKEVKSGKDLDAFSLSNSLQNKFFSISELVKGKVDIFLINETKLDEYFPRNQFAMSSYEFIRKDRNKFGVEYLLY